MQPVLTDLTAGRAGAGGGHAADSAPRTGADGTPPPMLVSSVRDDDQLVARLSTVDDLDRVSGRIATVLATVDAVPGSPVVGHYGMGDGADRLLPPAAGDG